MHPIGRHLGDKKPAFALVRAVLWACQDLNLGPHPDPKIHDEQAGGSIRAEPGSDQMPGRFGDGRQAAGSRVTL
jgi:hypothetical protein